MSICSYFEGVFAPESFIHSLTLHYHALSITLFIAFAAITEFRHKPVVKHEAAKDISKRAFLAFAYPDHGCGKVIKTNTLRNATGAFKYLDQGVQETGCIFSRYRDAETGIAVRE